MIGACGSAKKCALAKERGATHTINYRCEDVKARVKDVTNGKGANIILDAVGGHIFDQCLRRYVHSVYAACLLNNETAGPGSIDMLCACSIAYEGRIAVIGFAGGTIPKIPANLLLVKCCSAVGVWWGNSAVKNPAAFQVSVW